MHLSYPRRGSNAEQLIENINQPFEDTTVNVPRSTFNELLAAAKKLSDIKARSDQQLFSLILYAFIGRILNESTGSEVYQGSFGLSSFPVVTANNREKRISE